MAMRASLTSSVLPVTLSPPSPPSLLLLPEQSSSPPRLYMQGQALPKPTAIPVATPMLYRSSSYSIIVIINLQHHCHDDLTISQSSSFYSITVIIKLQHHCHQVTALLPSSTYSITVIIKLQHDCHHQLTASLSSSSYSITVIINIQHHCHQHQCGCSYLSWTNLLMLQE